MDPGSDVGERRCGSGDLAVSISMLLSIDRWWMKGKAQDNWSWGGAGTGGLVRMTRFVWRAGTSRSWSREEKSKGDDNRGF